MMRRLFVLSGVVMFCGFGMVFRGILMVLSAFMHYVDSLMCGLSNFP